MKPMAKRFLGTAEAAAYTGIPATTLRQYRYQGRGPKYTKPVGRVLYYIPDLDAFMKSGERVPRLSKKSK